MAAPGALAAALGRVQICLEQEYTAPAATRPLYADFLDEAAEVIGEPGLCRAATLFRRSAAHWSAIAATAGTVRTRPCFPNSPMPWTRPGPSNSRRHRSWWMRPRDPYGSAGSGPSTVVVPGSRGVNGGRSRPLSMAANRSTR